MLVAARSKGIALPLKPQGITVVNQPFRRSVCIYNNCVIRLKRRKLV